MVVFTFMQEWRIIEGLEGYEISNYGNVRNNKTGRIIKNCYDLNRYFIVTLRKNKLKKTISVHRLVAKAFIPNPYNKETVNYINGIKTDNKVENLEWATRKEQAIHRDKTGLRQIINNIRVINNITKETYNSIADLCNKENLVYSSMQAKLKGNRTNNTPYRYE